MDARIKTNESSHWYDRSGRPCHTVPNKSKPGEERAVTVRDARKLDLVPSVTSVLKVIANEALKRYIRGQDILAAATTPRNPNEDDQAWVDRVVESADEDAAKAAEYGTSVHRAIEDYLAGRPYDTSLQQYIDLFAKWFDQFKKGHGYASHKAEITFASPLGFGGCIDLCVQADDGDWIWDHKTSRTNPKYPIKGWDSWAGQLAAYRIGVGQPDARVGNLAYSTTEPGRFADIEWPEDQLKEEWEVFKAAQVIWKVRKGYCPEWTQN